MGVIQTVERQGRPLDQREEMPHPTGDVASLHNLSTWIILLGSVRLALAVAEGLLAGLDAVRNEPMSIQRWAAFFRDNPPIAMLFALAPVPGRGPAPDAVAGIAESRGIDVPDPLGRRDAVVDRGLGR